MDETRIALARETLRHWTSAVKTQDFHPPLPCEDALAIMVKAYDELKSENERLKGSTI